MSQDAPPNGSTPDPAEPSWSRVAVMQAKLHRWAAGPDVKSTIRSAWYPQVSSADRRYAYAYPAAQPMRSSDQYIRQGCYG